METFLFGIGRLNAYVFYGDLTWGFLDLERRHEIWLLYVSPNRRTWIRIQDSVNDKDILVILKRSALDCHRRRNNQYPNDLDMDERYAPSPGMSYGQTWWMRITILKGDLIVSSASLLSYVLVSSQGSPNLQFLLLA